MALNPQNLKPARTKEEARRRGKNGGIKSGEARRERKQLKDELLAILSDGDSQEKICIALIMQARRGNIKAFEVIRDTIGETIGGKLEISGSVSNPLTGLTDEEIRSTLAAMRDEDG